MCLEVLFFLECAGPIHHVLIRKDDSDDWPTTKTEGNSSNEATIGRRFYRLASCSDAGLKVDP